jgi:hypothetical protein
MLASNKGRSQDHHPIGDYPCDRHRRRVDLDLHDTGMERVRYSEGRKCVQHGPIGRREAAHPHQVEL